MSVSARVAHASNKKLARSFVRFYTRKIVFAIAANQAKRATAAAHRFGAGSVAASNRPHWPIQEEHLEFLEAVGSENDTVQAYAANLVEAAGD